jgi:hypothetical protein
VHRKDEFGSESGVALLHITPFSAVQMGTARLAHNQ